MVQGRKENSWKNIAYLLTSQVISMMGTMLVQYAIIWHVTLSTKSGFMLGVMNAVGLLPMIFVMPFAGVLADRYSRKKLAMLADGCVAFVSLGMAVMLFVHAKLESHVSLLLVVTLIRSLGQGVQTPAVSALLPQLAQEKQLPRVNGMDQTIQAGMMLASPALAAALLNFLPLAGIFLIDFVTAGIGISLMGAKVHVAKAKDLQEHKTSIKRSVFKELASGMDYLRGKKVLLSLVMAGFVGSFLSGAPANFGALQVTRKFHEGLWQLSAVEIGFAGGMLLGGFLVTIWGGFKNPIKTVTFGYALLIVPFMLLGLVTDFWAYLLVMFVIGMVVPLSRSAMVAFIQEKNDNQHMGRVMSLVTTTISIASPAATLILGPLADRVSLDLLMIGSGGCLLPLVLWLLWGRNFRH